MTLIEILREFGKHFALTDVRDVSFVVHGDVCSATGANGPCAVSMHAMGIEPPFDHDIEFQCDIADIVFALAAPGFDTPTAIAHLHAETIELANNGASYSFNSKFRGIYSINKKMDALAKTIGGFKAKGYVSTDDIAQLEHWAKYIKRDGERITEVQFASAKGNLMAGYGNNRFMHPVRLNADYKAKFEPFDLMLYVWDKTPWSYDLQAIVKAMKAREWSLEPPQLAIAETTVTAIDYDDTRFQSLGVDEDGFPKLIRANTVPDEAFVRLKTIPALGTRSECVYYFAGSRGGAELFDGNVDKDEIDYDALARGHLTP